MNRRSFIATSLLAPFAFPLGKTLGESPLPNKRLGKADHCIFLWLGGGMSQVDTFDPKQLGQNQGDKKLPGSLYPSI